MQNTNTTTYFLLESLELKNMTILFVRILNLNSYILLVRRRSGITTLESCLADLKNLKTWFAIIQPSHFTPCICPLLPQEHMSIQRLENQYLCSFINKSFIMEATRCPSNGKKINKSVNSETFVE